jgi:hypothetical protein
MRCGLPVISASVTVMPLSSMREKAPPILAVPELTVRPDVAVSLLFPQAVRPTDNPKAAIAVKTGLKIIFMSAL